MTKPAVLKTDDFLLGAEGISMGPIAVRLARKPGEIEAAQKLRYDVFYREYGAKPVGEMAAREMDFDAYDGHADHLIVIDRRIDTIPERIVGTYRIIGKEAAKKVGRFYSASEFDISCLEKSGLNLIEVGRSCVHPDYRNRRVLQLLWQGIAEYVTWYGVDGLFGCASFQGVDVPAHADMLSYLHHYHRAPDLFCPRALPDQYVGMNLIPKDQLNPKEALLKLPPLIKGYLRLGGFVGDGAIIDTQFNTIDVCVIVKIKQVSDRYRKHYERKVANFSEEDVTASSEII